MKTKLLSLAGLLVLAVSCKTYTVPVDSFRNQMTAPGFANSKNAHIDPSLEYTASSREGIKTYRFNPLNSIEVYNKKGAKVRLESSPKLEVNVTKKDGKKHMLFFDMVTVENDTLKGGRSRMFLNMRREIALTDIEEIKIIVSARRYEYD